MSSAGDDVIILHQFPRLYPKLPNTSPPCMKLETFLRMTKIKYTVNTQLKFSSKGKMPWIEHKGKAVADSAFCIEYLCRELGVDVDSELTSEGKAIARAFRVMLEENTYWTIVYYRFLDPSSETFRKTIMPTVPVALRGIHKGQLLGHGIGRHTDMEIYGIAEKDLRAISDFLGDKKFLFGDKPCLTDAALFAIAACFIWGLPDSPQEKLIKEELTNLLDHAKRMMEMYFPDIDELTKSVSDSNGVQENSE